jgi:hypothetical protein
MATEVPCSIHAPGDFGATLANPQTTHVEHMRRPDAVAYGTDPERLRRLPLERASEHPKELRKAEPEVSTVTPSDRLQ